ncbi:putative T7SS-secreted protein [Streptomyces marispadix]|uniref:Putative T7SS secretion signal domain-containing protein n=1 Tax=Streptomyces marispadix TaxID=2922868 RepID=A0ABS9SW92_9ACTN|nr:hypothetical protein [Streptomyces marispadix]MCH6160545.1 hypothetical protein [Streptomyces marispadix]
MFIEDDSSWPGLGFNPAKGDTEAIDLLASDVKAVGDELEELDQLIKSVGERGGAWEGEAAERFTKKLGELPKYLKQGTDSMHDCAKALRTWHGKLQELQQRAERTEADAVEARKRAKQDADRYNSLNERYAGVMMEADQVKRVNSMLEEAKGDVDASNERIDQLVREGEKILANWKDRAGEAERAILKASENHPPDLGLWGRISDALSEGWRDFKEWLIDNADTLSNWSAGLGVAAIAVNAIPVVGQAASVVLATASSLCAAGAMAGHWMDNARGGKTPGWKIGLDALGTIPVVGGATKGAIAGIKGGTGLAGKAGSAARGLTGRVIEKGQPVNHIYQKLENPISTKLINGSLKKAFGKTEDVVPAAATTATIKGATAVKGAWEQLQKPDPGSTSVVAPSSDRFHQTLAA